MVPSCYRRLRSYPAWSTIKSSPLLYTHRRMLYGRGSEARYEDPWSHRLVSSHLAHIKAFTLYFHSTRSFLTWNLKSVCAIQTYSHPPPSPHPSSRAARTTGTKLKELRLKNVLYETQTSGKTILEVLAVADGINTITSFFFRFVSFNLPSPLYLSRFIAVIVLYDRKQKIVGSTIFYYVKRSQSSGWHVTFTAIGKTRTFKVLYQLRYRLTGYWLLLLPKRSSRDFTSE